MDWRWGKYTKYFLGLEKARQTKKTITSLYDRSGNITHDQSEILNIEKKYYENLYSSSNPDYEIVKSYIQNTEIDRKLSSSESNVCDGKLTIEECTEAIFKMKLNRSPGSDGIPVEFYRKFWSSLKYLLVKVCNIGYDLEEMSNSQKMGTISLIFKKNDPHDLNNYRPITLMNIDTKLIAYTLALRLKKVIHLIINDDQCGYIKNRFIGFNIRKIQDIIDYAEKLNISGAILFLDFSKAFDSLEWDFMFEALKKFGFNDSFLKWIKTLYNNIKGSIVNNGWVSEPYSIRRGIKQGCPLSSLIFVIAVEILATKIRKENGLKGFEIKYNKSKCTLKISQMADDATIFLKSKEEVSNVLNIIEIFGSISGLILNKSKTEGNG